jgi:hypothetical protein
MKISDEELMCSVCGEVKPKKEFYKDSHTSSGYKSACRSCINHGKRRKVEQRKAENGKQISNVAENDDAGSMSTGVREEVARMPYPTEYPEWVFKDQVKNDEMFSMSIVASRKSGKTTFLYNLADELDGRFDLVILCSNSLQAGTYDFAKKRQNWALFDEYDSRLIGICESLQRQTENAFKFCFILDDCSSLTQVKYSDELLQLFIRGRNMKMSVIVSTQSPMLINKNSRQNTDFLVLLKLRTPDMKEDVVNHFIRGSLPIPSELWRQHDREEYMQEWLRRNSENHGIRIFNYVDEEIYSYTCKKLVPGATL